MKPRFQCVQTHWKSSFMASGTRTRDLMSNLSFSESAENRAVEPVLSLWVQVAEGKLAPWPPATRGA
jgi:hypothetical protein